MMMILSDLPEAIREAAADLDENGQRALETAASAVDAERYPFAVLRYARAVELAERTRAEWRDHGAPLLSTHINGATVVHPLVRLLRVLYDLRELDEWIERRKEKGRIVRANRHTV